MYKDSSPKYYQKTKNEEEKETKQQYGIKRYQNLPKYEKKKVEKRMTMIAIIIIIFFNIDICFIAFEYMLMLLKIAYAS